MILTLQDLQQQQNAAFQAAGGDSEYYSKMGEEELLQRLEELNRVDDQGRSIYGTDPYLQHGGAESSFTDANGQLRYRIGQDQLTPQLIAAGGTNGMLSYDPQHGYSIPMELLDSDAAMNRQDGWDEIIMNNMPIIMASILGGAALGGAPGFAGEGLAAGSGTTAGTAGVAEGIGAGTFGDAFGYGAGNFLNTAGTAAGGTGAMSPEIAAWMASAGYTPAQISALGAAVPSTAAAGAVGGLGAGLTAQELATLGQYASAASSAGGLAGVGGGNADGSDSGFAGDEYTVQSQGGTASADGSAGLWDSLMSGGTSLMNNPLAKLLLGSNGTQNGLLGLLGGSGGGGSGLLGTLASTAPALAAVNYARNQSPFDTSRLTGLYNQYSPEAQAGQYDVNTGLGRNKLTSNLARRGISGSSFGDQSLTNFNTARDVGRQSLVNQGVGTQAGIAGQILSGDIASQTSKNDLYGRALLALSGGLGGNSANTLYGLLGNK